MTYSSYLLKYEVYRIHIPHVFVERAHGWLKMDIMHATLGDNILITYHASPVPHFQMKALW